MEYNRNCRTIKCLGHKQVNLFIFLNKKGK